MILLSDYDMIGNCSDHLIICWSDYNMISKKSNYELGMLTIPQNKDVFPILYCAFININ